MPLYLAVYDDPNHERVFRLQDAEGLVIGRSPEADLQLADLSVSRRHCLLRVQGERVWLTDTQSLNGTWFEKERLGDTPLELPVGKPFRLGTTWLSLHQTPGITEGDWNSQHDPSDYLRFLPLPGSQRKLRLFACACYRQIEGEALDPQHEAAVSTAERHADGQASREELIAARNRSSGVMSYWFRDTQKLPELAHWVAETSARDAATRTLRAVSRLMPSSRLCDLARDMLGDFFSPVRIAPEWRQWNHGTVLRMARQIYEERDFAGLPILADALEEAGCNEPRLLDHCRARTCHARGCWALDAILGKL